MIDLLIVYIQPLSGLGIGFLILAIIGYINWHGGIKQTVVKWIAKHIFRNEMRSERSAEGLFMTATAFSVMVSGMWIVLALLYLTA